MENLENKTEEVKVESPVETVESPKVEEEVSEPVKVEVAPEAPKASDAIVTDSLARSTQETPAVGSVANGAIGVTTAPKPAPKPKATPSKKAAEKTVAIHSTKNVTWSGVGKVYTGYNIVTEDESEKWLTRGHIRLATPEEVAREFGK